MGPTAMGNYFACSDESSESGGGGGGGGGGGTIPMVVFIILMSIADGIAFGYAHMQRQKMLQAAKSGQQVAQPSGLWKYFCPVCAIYYWEGFGGNCWMACLCHWFAICCWKASPSPMENGTRVGPPVAVTTPGVVGGAS